MEEAVELRVEEAVDELDCWGVAVVMEAVGCLRTKQGHWTTQGVLEAVVEAVVVEAGLPDCQPSDDSFQARGLCDVSATRHRGSWRRTWFRSWGYAPAADVSGRQLEGSRVGIGTCRP